jgi:hypothetical protein
MIPYKSSTFLVSEGAITPTTRLLNSSTFHKPEEFRLTLTGRGELAPEHATKSLISVSEISEYLLVEVSIRKGKLPTS